MLKIVVDSGGTKTDWCVMVDGEVRAMRSTQGINPFHQSPDIIDAIVANELLGDESFRETLSHNACEGRAEGFFYGSGCLPVQARQLEKTLDRHFDIYNVRFSASSDLLGAARALCGRKPGIACILGTGANSCLYDGKEILQNTPPLGYILGDEGSGAYLGKTFLNGIFKGWLPETLRDDYLSWAGLRYADVIDKVYRQPMANRFLASIVPFISMRIADCSCLDDMVTSSFRNFFRYNISCYQRSDLPVGFVGGVANAFACQLAKAAELEGLGLGKVIARPMEELVRYHAVDILPSPEQ